MVPGNHGPQRHTNPKRRRGQLVTQSSLTLRVSMGPRIIRARLLGFPSGFHPPGQGYSPARFPAGCTTHSAVAEIPRLRIAPQARFPELPAAPESCRSGRPSPVEQFPRPRSRHFAEVAALSGGQNAAASKFLRASDRTTRGPANVFDAHSWAPPFSPRCDHGGQHGRP